MPIKAVIFDFGGVMGIREDWSRHRKWEKRLGLREKELSEKVYLSEVGNRATIGQATTEEVWQQVVRDFGLDTEQARELRRDFEAAELFNEELASFLRSLRPRYKTAILSNAWFGAREIFTETYKLDDMVDVIIVSYEEGLAKPDPRIFQLVCERLHARPSEIIFVDDWPPHVQAASALGMKGIVYQTNEQVMADVRKCLEED
ncbi:MAG TPA: HAD family phosphatase [Ktedonobacteraceae bacterium]|jgi:epoxide hydrolase-like predicted phosphatase|nr:HAD family phosphatase [Ktedonobacteraceae bacterium]